MQAPANAGQACSCHFFNQHGAAMEISANATVFLRQTWTEEAQLTSLIPELTANLAVLFPLLMIGHGFLFKKLSDGVAKSFEIGVEESTWNHGRPQCETCICRLPSLGCDDLSLNDEKHQSSWQKPPSIAYSISECACHQHGPHPNAA